MSRFVLYFAGPSSDHCFKVFVLWRGIVAGSRCRCLQWDHTSVHHTVSVCLVPAHEMIHLLQNFPVCIGGFINPQRGLFGICFSVPNWGPATNNVLWARNSSFHCWATGVLCYLFFTWDNSERGKRKDWKSQRRRKINLSKGKGVFSEQFSWDTHIWKFAKICLRCFL